MNNIVKVQRRITCLACLLFLVSCSGKAISPEVQSHRVVIGDTELTFEQQMLYLIAALEIYRLHIGDYPSEKHNLEALIAKPDMLEATGEWYGPYADSADLFLDPWGKHLFYSPDVNGEMDLRSLGKDGIRSEDDWAAKEMFPDWYREMKKVKEATQSSGEHGELLNSRQS